MHKDMKLLGYEVQDVVTGFKGIAETVAFDLYGCVQVIVRPRISKNAKTSEKPAAEWFDAKRLKTISAKPVMPVPSFDAPIGGTIKPGRTAIAPR